MITFKTIVFNIINGYTITFNNLQNEINVNIGTLLDYSKIISELINYKYTQDQVTSITLNYLLTLHQEVLDPEKVKEYEQEYKKLQEYRAACKVEAKKAIEYVEINGIHP